MTEEEIKKVLAEARSEGPGKDVGEVAVTMLIYERAGNRHLLGYTACGAGDSYPDLANLKVLAERMKPFLKEGEEVFAETCDGEFCLAEGFMKSVKLSWGPW